jgi:hypothetical protein
MKTRIVPIGCAASCVALLCAIAIAAYAAIITVTTNSTLSNNYASLSGGGIEGGTTLGNTILNAKAPENIYGGGSSHGYNLSSDDGGGKLTGSGDQINTDPMLGSLQDNGGSL